MSIRALALDLYRAQQEVDRLDQQLAAASPGDRDGIAEELRQAREHLRLLRRMMDGEKEPKDFRRKFE